MQVRGVGFVIVYTAAGSGLLQLSIGEEARNVGVVRVE